MDDIDRLTYTVPVVTLDEAGLDTARALDPIHGWYARRRITALTAALSKLDFERLHPRGPDGKFIEKFGFVRWLFGGTWRRGEVRDIKPNGSVMVAPDVDPNTLIEFNNPSKTLYAVPRPKAQLDLPNPKSHNITKGFEKVGGQAGSNPGGFYTVTEALHEAHLDQMGGDLPEPGDKLYVKTAKSPDHARQELLANRLYEMAGVPVPDVTIGEDGVTIASKVVKPVHDSQELTQVVNSGDSDMLHRIQEDMVVDAWLANWDVVGLAYDNMRVVDGVPYRLDAGGALEYRAKGGAKGNKFGNTVGELDTLRDKSMNATAAKVFGGMTVESQKRGAQRIAALSPEDIRDAVQEAGVSDTVADKLIARRKHIMMTLGVLEPKDLKSPLPEATTVSTVTSIGVIPSEKPNLGELVFDSVVGAWVPGTAVDPIQMKMAFNSNLETWPGQKESQFKTLHDGDLVFHDSQLWVVSPTSSDEVIRLSNLGSKEEFVVNSSKLYASTVARDPDREKMYKLLHGGVVTADINDYVEKHGANDVFFDTSEHMLAGPSQIETHTMPRTQVKQEFLENVKSDGTRRDRYAYLAVPGYDTPQVLRIEDIITSPGVSDFEDDLVFVGTDMDGNAHTVHLGDPDQAWEPIQITGNDFTEQLLDAYFSLNDMEVALDKEDFPDEVPSVVPEPMDPEPLDEAPKAPGVPDPIVSPKIATAPTLDPPTTPQYPPVDFVSVSLPIAGEKIALGEELSGSSPESLEADLAALNLVGRTFLFTRGAATVHQDGFKTPSNGYYGREGLFQITSVSAQPATKYSGARAELHGINAAGNSASWQLDLKSLQEDATGVSIVPIDMEMKPLQPATLKQDGTIVLGGMKIGTWEKKGWKYNTWIMKIDAGHSAYGVETQMTFHNQKTAKRGLAPHIVPREILEPVVIPKHDKALTQEVKSIDAGKSAGTLIGGDQAVVGQWVMSTKDGLVGKITGFPNLEKYPNDVWVTTPDGVKKSRKITMLKGVPDPSAKELVVPFNDTKLSDGTPVAIGMRVRVGTTAKEIEGVVLKSNADGYVQVLDDSSGKKLWRKASTGVLLEAPDPDAVPEMKTGMKTSSPGKALGAVKYPAPDGSVLPSQGKLRDDWVALGRGLTKDGYVPMVGMRVRDSKGSNSLVVVRVKSVYDPSPNSVKVYDPSQKKYLWRAVTGLHVDHAAELGSGDSAIPRVKELLNGGGAEIPNLPDGSVIYKVVTQQYVYGRGTGGGSYASVSRYYVAKPTTGGSETMLLVRDEYAAPGSSIAWSLIERAETVERVAVVDSSSNLRAQTSTNNSTKQQKLSVFDPNVTTHALIVNADEVKDQEAKLALAGGVAPKTVEATSITPLPRPHVPDENNVFPTIPQITGAGSGKTFADPPKSLPQAASILGAVHGVVASRGSSAPGSSLHYGLGDADLIEDMIVRTQIVVDDNGKESVELRFHLHETAIDKLADQLLVKDGAKKGAWTQTSVTPDALLPGDQISVRKASTTGALKPGQGEFVPNGTVAGAPKLIGQSTNGLDLYRIPVTFNDGSLGEVDAEKRLSASIVLHTFDPEKTQAGTGQAMLSPRAAEEGWTQVADKMGYSYGSTPLIPTGSGGSSSISGISGVYLDENGRKHITDGNFTKVAAGRRLRRQLDDGSFVDVNVAPTEPGARNSTSSNVGSTPQRATVNGDVTIRVPLPDGTSDENLETVVGDSVSRLLEAVGVPLEKQAAPSKEQLARYALNKVHKQYAKSYKHGDTPHVNDPTNLSEVQGVLAEINDAIGDKLGRPAKLSDIHFRVWDGGRVQVVMSREVADAVTKTQNLRYYRHNLYSDGMENILTGTAHGLMPSDERWSAGVLTGGMSPDEDNLYDAAGRLFLSAVAGAGSPSAMSGSHGAVYFAPSAINNSTEIYLNPGDGFGKRKSDNRQWLRHGGHELMYKRRVEPSQFGFAVVPTATTRENLIKKLKKKGITHFGLIPIEDVIVVSGSVVIPPDWDANVGAGGVEIPLTTIIASPEAPTEAVAEGAVSATP